MGTIRQQILDAIQAVDDQNHRTTLLLMLQVIEEIGSKIDQVLSDEQRLRVAVLDGHSDRHHAHHDWIEGQMQVASHAERSRRMVLTNAAEKALWFLVGAVGYFILSHPMVAHLLVR